MAESRTINSRGIVRVVIIGVGLVALVAVSMLVGRLTGGQQEPAAVQQPAEEATPSPDDGAAAEEGGAHEHGGDPNARNPWLVEPDGPIQEWSDSVTYTDPDGTSFTVHVELAEPSDMGMCSMGPMASEYSRTVVISVRNDGGQPATGPRIGVKDKRIGFSHADGMGCSWVYPSDVDGEYEPDGVKTFRGLLKTEPAGEDVIIVLRPDEELLRIPADAFADA